MPKSSISLEKEENVVQDDILFIKKSIKKHFKPGIYLVYNTKYSTNMNVRRINAADEAFNFLTCDGNLYEDYLKFWIRENLFIHLKSKEIVDWKYHYSFYAFIKPIENAIKEELWARKAIIDEIYYWSWEKISKEELEKYSDEELIKLCKKYVRCL